jgi:hypothetical protein
MSTQPQEIPDVAEVQVKPEPVLPEAPKPGPIEKPRVTSSKDLVGRNELAKLSGMRASTIKHYTEIGLLPFEQKETRLARRYNSEAALKRLEEIKQLKDQGLSISEIQQRLSESA